MARFWIGCLAALVVGQAASAQITLGFIGDEGKFGKHNMPAYEWAKGNYDTTVIPVADVPGADLKQYGVVWWHDGDANPALAWDEGAGDTLVSYLEAGGTVLLSAGAEQLATSMGVESGVPRWYATAADAHLAGLVVRDDTAKHPVWKG
ncbi:MAG: hypothetical protein O3A46_13285, partial [Candidatus Poribacteria bacterium]|nr:hypothetical protein [Candidatus Poribacteria bacterium]